jgi:ribosomal protein S18 acetylase RimI-like enzyme
MSIRLATPGDAFDLAAIHIRVWRETYRGLMPDAFLDGFSLDTFRQRWVERLNTSEPRVAILVAHQPSHGTIGFGVCGPTRDPRLESDGEIYAINIVKDGHRQGFGKQLMQAMARALESNEFRQVGLWVLEANRPAREFYDRLGGRLGAVVQHEFGGRMIPEVAYLWTSPSGLEVAASRSVR